MRPNFLIKIIILTALPFLLALFVSGCKNSPPTKVWDKPAVWNTPRENKEAEEAALWLSDCLIAHENLYDAILRDLASIRAKYGESIPQVKITFMPPWRSDQLIVGITDDAKQQIRAGKYHDLDYLNSMFQLVSIDTSLFRYTSVIVPTFEGRYNPKRLAEIYKTVPSVTYAEPNGFGGDWSNVYPWLLPEGLSYLFREGEGDCPSGCIHNCYWYFRVPPSGIEYIGTWCPPSGLGNPEPEWWWEAKQGMIRFRGY